MFMLQRIFLSAALKEAPYDILDRDNERLEPLTSCGPFIFKIY